MTAAALLLWMAGSGCATSSSGRDPTGIDEPGPGETATPMPATTSEPASVPAAPVGGGSSTADCPEWKSPVAVERAAVVRAVDRGLGHWLAGVGVTAVRDGGRFRGWRVDRLYPDDPCYARVDVRPGDVIVRVNGSTLERPEHANQVFQRLRTAPRLQIVRLREGVPATINLEIVD